MTEAINVRPLQRSDRAQWQPLWDGYNAFYGRAGDTALPAAITDCTWERFFNPVEPVFGLVAETGNEIVGITHYLFHRSTTRIEPVCYLQDLFTRAEQRGRGIGRALIKGVYDQARQAGAGRVYWHTQETNRAGRLLYDKMAAHLGFIVYTQDGL